ncbi:MAG: ABC transporter ATP-binding protein [Candidatus Rokuibacteriota bacterium]
MLTLEGVDVYYEKRQVLFGISLQVGKGEFVALLGANGAGKTTTLRLLSGLVKPARGRIEFGGENIAGRNSAAIVRLGIAHCPEGRRVWPQMTVWENLMMGAYVARRQRDIARDLDRVYFLYPILRERSGQLAGSLSGGEQQMLSIGRALMVEPTLLLLDEPSLGLAPRMIEKTAETIQKIHKQGTAVLLVEQNAFLALNLAERAYVLETGRIALEGRAQALLNHDHVRRAYLGSTAARATQGVIREPDRRGNDAKQSDSTR